MKRFLLVLLVIAVYVLHQDVWNWRAAHPLVFGFLPIGIAYHACYTIAVAGLMWLLVRFAWPAHLEETDAVTGRHGDVANVSPSSSPTEGSTS